MASNKPNVTLWRELHAMADAAAHEFSFRYERIEPTQSMRKQKFGECFADKVIAIRVHTLGRPTHALTRQTIVHTLAHELAHLKEWDHGKKHRELTKRILKFWKKEGLYP